ncbi:hypothetical protein LXA43DRAFT_317266 [Ganoderma leucocontextum]|nr:hypothetical protein LXA43DRAFT_317266 [Ganoderma leucocontextum]
MSHRRSAPSSNPNIPPYVWAGLAGETTALDVPADRLRKHLKIPDVTTRSGLRKIHTDFDGVSQRLDECYVTALSHGDTAGATLVCVIWTKIAADVVLRQQLIRAGLIPKIIPLFGLPHTGGLAEELLKALIRNTDGANTEEFALEIFRHNLDIVRILRDHPDDADVLDCTIMALAQGFLRTILRHSSSHPSVFDDACLVPVLSALLDTLRNPPELLPEATLNVAMIILARVPPVCPARCRLREIPSLLAYYAALSRSRHLRARCNAIATVRHLARAELEPVLHGDDDVLPIVTRSGDLAWHAYASQEELLAVFPEDLRSLMLAYGVDACECVVQFKSSSDAASALSQYYRDDDLCALGLRLAELLQLAESVIDPNADLDLPHHGNASDGTKLKQLDVLPLCAAALTERQGSAELDAADVLRLHYLLAMQADPKQVYLRAQHARRRNPHLAYAHYAYATSFSLSAADVVLRLREIKNAVGCDGQTPFLQHRLICRAVQVAGEHAFSLLHGVVDVTREPELLAMTYFRHAIDAANVYLQLAPPDARQLPIVLSWYVVLQLVAEAPRPREDLSDYEPLLERIRTAERFAEILRRHLPTKTHIQLTREWLFEQYRSGSIRQWDRLILRLGGMDDDVSELINAPLPAFSFASVTANRVRLDQCSWCKNSTVSLKKCSRCKEARYCSTTCQKADWPRHKVPCRRSAPV